MDAVLASNIESMASVPITPSSGNRLSPISRSIKLSTAGSTLESITSVKLFVKVFCNPIWLALIT